MAQNRNFIAQEQEQEFDCSEQEFAGSEQELDCSEQEFPCRVGLGPKDCFCEECELIGKLLM